MRADLMNLSGIPKASTNPIKLGLNFLNRFSFKITKL